MGQLTRYSKGCTVTRITREIDFTSARGVEVACNAILGPRSLVWFSLPCIGGCPWQSVNIRLGPDAERRIRGYLGLFAIMFRNALQLMAVAQDAGATIVIEWPRACRYWHYNRVRRALDRFGLSMYDFDGCMYGIKSILPKTRGTPIRKPWRIATNSPIIGQAFSQKCDGFHPAHAPCAGGDTRQTEGYSRRMADKFHRAFKLHCMNTNQHPSVAISARDAGSV